MREPQNEEGDRPLSGVRVLDLADEKGELAGRLLADLGASVVRVEPPEGGRSRGLPPFKDGCSLYFATRNSNKLGLALDLDSDGNVRYGKAFYGRSTQNGNSSSRGVPERIVLKA
ncbi:MAG: CoA transferase [Proteobacteria bacterium]|nr:CoA transferase [Pseudomonadota bacterium]